MPIIKFRYMRFNSTRKTKLKFKSKMTIRQTTEMFAGGQTDLYSMPTIIFTCRFLMLSNPICDSNSLDARS